MQRGDTLNREPTYDAEHRAQTRTQWWEACVSQISNEYYPRGLMTNQSARNTISSCMLPIIIN